MPNVTIFFSAKKMPSEEKLASLSEQCTQLCTGILKAALENVHIIFVAVMHGKGYEAFAEIKYRLEPLRTKAVMESFMSELDEVISNNIGLSARIRCFGFAEGTVYACN